MTTPFDLVSNLHLKLTQDAHQAYSDAKTAEGEKKARLDARFLNLSEASHQVSDVATQLAYTMTSPANSVEAGRYREILARLYVHFGDTVQTVETWFAHADLSPDERIQWEGWLNERQGYCVALKLALDETPETRTQTEDWLKSMDAQRDDFLLRFVPPSDDPV